MWLLHSQFRLISHKTYIETRGTIKKIILLKKIYIYILIECFLLSQLLFFINIPIKMSQMM